MQKKQRVLFLCSGNSNRSQMAEAFLENIAGNRFEALSAGLETKDSIHPMAIAVMREKGIDISSKKTKDVDAFLGKEFIHYLIVLCDVAREACPHVWPGMLPECRFYWPTPDPAGLQGSEEEKLHAFRTVRDEIEKKIEQWVKEQTGKAN